MASRIETDLMESMSAAKSWMIFTGIAMIVLGIVAYLAPFASSLSVLYVLATVFVIGGIVLFIQVFTLWGSAHNGLRFMRALVSLVAGVLMFRYPGAGLMGITLALIFYFFVSAAMQWMVSAELPSRRTWGVVGGLLSLAFGLIVLFTFPVSAFWVPGLLLGIDFVFAGATLLPLAFALPSGRGHLRHATA